MKRLLSPDPIEGGDIPPTNPDPPTPAPAPIDPPAAKAVLEGDRTEREIQLQEELQSERERTTKLDANKRDRETKIAELEDQLRQLRTSPGPAAEREDSIRVGFYNFEE